MYVLFILIPLFNPGCIEIFDLFFEKNGTDNSNINS